MPSAKNARQTAQHTIHAGHQANSPPTPSRTERWALPRLNAHTTNTKSDARRTPCQHTDTAERWVSPKARRGHGTVLGPAPADSPPAHRPSGAAGLPAPLTPHTTSSRRLNAGSSRAASEGSNAGPASPRKAPRRPSPAGGLPASQEVRPPYFLPSVQRAHAHATLHTSHPQSRHGPSVTEPGFQQLHVPGARGAHQHEGFPTILLVGTHRSPNKTCLRRADKRPEGNRRHFKNTRTLTMLHMGPDASSKGSRQRSLVRFSVGCFGSK